MLPVAAAAARPSLPPLAVAAAAAQLRDEAVDGVAVLHPVRHTPQEWGNAVGAKHLAARG